jgi:short-subunit dehydrogenase
MILSLLLIFRLCIYVYGFIRKHFLTQELDLPARYGKDSWVLITGCSLGQGKRFAIEFAKRGFNIILSGFKEILEVEALLKKYPVKTKSIIVDFSEAHQPEFFAQFEEAIKDIDLSILVNNVGYRVGWNKYHEMPPKLINDSIIVGTIVQARMTQLALKKFVNRDKSAIIDITALCVGTSVIPGNTSYLSIPYLSVYEAANVFGFFHSNSIQKEYKNSIDILNITPGAVITESTEFLADKPFAIKSKPFVKNILKLLGNYSGPTCAYWGHEIAYCMIGFNFQFYEDIVRQVGETIAKQCMALNKV